jgi:serine/threonine-protein kinase
MSAPEHLRARLGDRYTIERELGRGGMGVVYLARDVRLDRPVALKVLPAEFVAQPSLRDRFLRETRTAASFSHPNIVPVYAVEQADDLLAYAMGFIEGESLAERVKRAGPLGVRETVRMLQDVAYALAYAHGRGVVHRDIKPDNIMIERATGRALVMDFGIARVIEATSANAGLTRVGEVVGTPEYMSPEQATGDTVDGRSDLYALGLTAYFALTARAAMSADSAGKVLARQITEAVPPMRTVRADIPAPLADAIDRCLVKDPAGRFASAESLVEALDAAQLGAPEIPLPIRLFAQEASTLGLMIVGGLLVAIYGIPQGEERALDNLDFLLPEVLVFAVLLTRALQTLREARRLALAGFTPDNVQRGLEMVVAERAYRRDELRADAPTRRARRRTVIVASVMLAGSAAMFRAALIFRTRVGPTQYMTTLPGAILVVSAVLVLGISVVLLLRSPSRMSIGERLFRLVWLGPVGRAFVRFAGRGVNPAAAAVGTSGAVSRGSGAQTASPSPPRTPGTVAPVPSDRVSALESRVDALERWRRDHGDHRDQRA